MPGWILKEQIDVPCTIDIENTFESLHAYVELDGNLPINPGDEVLVHGEPVRVPYGQKLTLRRLATVTRATAFERMWTKLIAWLKLTELYEVSFSSGGRL